MRGAVRQLILGRQRRRPYLHPLVCHVPSCPFLATFATLYFSLPFVIAEKKNILQFALKSCSLIRVIQLLVEMIEFQRTVSRRVKIGFVYLHHWKKKWSHFDLKNRVTGWTKIESGFRIIGEYMNWLDIESQFDSNILQLLRIPGRILISQVTKLFRSIWLYFFFQCLLYRVYKHLFYPNASNFVWF